MTDEKLIQATLLALTKQNVTGKGGGANPFSGKTIEAMCIKQNIKESELVGIAKNLDVEVNRLGDMYSTNGTWWVDRDGKLYDRSGNNLRIRDGLSGEVLSISEPCYEIYVFDNVLGYCVVQYDEEEWISHTPGENSYQTWRFRYYDGTVSGDIKLPWIAWGYSSMWGYTYNRPIWGFRNNILGISHNQLLASIYTYTKSGSFIYQTAALSGGMPYPYIEHIFPITAYRVGAWVSYVTGGWTQVGTDNYRIFSDTIISYDWLFEPYYDPSGNTGQGSDYLGTDGYYFYAANQLHDPENPDTLLNEWVVAKFNIENYNGPYEIGNYTTPRIWYGEGESGLIAYRQASLDEQGVYEYYFVDRDSLNELYGGALYFTTTNSNLSITIRDNKNYIWISNRGIYQKSDLDWVMWRTEYYPHEDQLLGYATEDVNLGSVGIAAVLFTREGNGPVPPAPNLRTKFITENGTYIAYDDGYDGYSRVIVQVAGGGGGSGTSATILDNAYFPDKSYSYYAVAKYIANGTNFNLETQQGEQSFHHGRSGNKTYQFLEPIPEDASYLYIKAYASGSRGQWNLWTLHLKDAIGLGSSTIDGPNAFIGNDLLTLHFTAYSSTPEAIMAQSGVEIDVEDQYSVPKQTIVVDLSSVTEKSYLSFQSCDCDVYFYKVWFA